MLDQFVRIFLDIVFPVFFVAAVGFAVGKIAKIDTRSISGLLIYALTPLFIISELGIGDLPDVSFTSIVVFILLHTLVMGAIGYGAGKALGLASGELKVFLLTIVIPNAGNYPLPVNEFAWGEAGVVYGTCIMIPYQVLTMTLGVFLATGDRSAKDSLATIFKLPLIYAVFLVLFMQWIEFDLEKTPLYNGVEYAARAMLPLNLLQLGFVLAATRWVHPERNGDHPETSGHLWAKVGLAVFLKLVIGPLTGAPLLYLIGADGQLFRSLMVLASMPNAVYTAILATFFGSDTRHVVATIMVGTLLSMGTVTVVLAWLETAVP